MKPSPVTLCISCVIYDTPITTLRQTLKSLAEAIQYSAQKNTIEFHALYLINNQLEATQSFNDIVAYAKECGINTNIKTGHGNIGYGKGNNLAIFETDSTYHLILNPDVILDPLAIHTAIQFLNTHKSASLIAPQATNEQGEIEYLAKREPNALIIFLRGLNNTFLNTLFKNQLENYIYKDLIPNSEPIEIELASGCFMLCKTEKLRAAGGFSPEYFLYFEDFDLSKKLRKEGKIYYHPNVKIIHSGGNTARKGFNHIKMFLKSYLLYRKLNH